MYDVIIIGAGIIGSSVAYYLSQYDIKVAHSILENYYLDIVNKKGL